MKLLCIDINICRVCKRQSSSSSQSLFDGDVAEKFTFLTGLEATPDDGLPSKLCEKCVKRLKIAAEFKRESHIADTNFRQFIAKVNAQFQELTIYNETSNDDGDLEFLLSTGNSTSGSKLEPDKNPSVVTMTGTSFLNAVKLQPQSTQRDLQFTRNVVQTQSDAPQEAKMQNDEIYVESYDLVDGDHMQEAEELEETIEEYQTVQESAQVVYISIDDNKSQFPFVEQAQSVMSADETCSSKEGQGNQRHQQQETTIKSNGNTHFCNQCQKSFSTKTNLFRHVATHDGRRPYVCSVCQKSFSQNSSLKQHYLLHTGEKPYKCNVCERSFTQAKSLTFHMRRHTGEKPFTCDICNVQFRQKDGMKRHVLLKHTLKEEPREIFSCDVCSKVLFSRYSLANHKRKHVVKEPADDKEQTVVVQVMK